MTSRDDRGMFVKKDSQDPLRSDPLIEDWLNAYESKWTRRTYFSQLKYFLGKNGLSPEQFLSLENGKARDLVISELRSLRDINKHSKVKAVGDATKSFRAYYEKPLEFRKQDKFRRVRKKISSGQEHVPTPEEIYRMINESQKERDKALIAILYQTGLRLNAIQKLTLGMLRPYLYPEINAPIPIRVNENLDTKLRSSEIGYYFTFLARDGSEYLKNFTDQLKDKPDDYRLFGFHEGTILNIVKKLAKKIGLDPKTVWTHLFRKSFRKVLNSLSSTLDEDTKEALMGHKLPGARGNYFDYADLEEIKEKYSRLQFWTQNVGLSELKQENRNLKQQISILQLDLGELRSELEKFESVQKILDDPRKWLQAQDAYPPDGLTREQLGEWMNRRYGDPRIEVYDANLTEPETISLENKIKEIVKNVLTEKNHSTFSYRTIEIDNEKELISLLEGGWEIYREINGKIILRKLK